MGFLDKLLNKAENMVSNKTSSTVRQATSKVAQGVEKAADKAIADFKKKKKTVTFEKLPTSVEELASMPGGDHKDPFEVAALVVAVMNNYENDKEITYKMLEYIRGAHQDKLPERDKQFMRDQLSGKMYVMRSYFDGTSPENNYKIESPYSITINDNPYSYDNAGYIKLWLTSSGADSQREISLRKKESTGEWFLWEQFLLSGIRIPKQDDAWA